MGFSLDVFVIGQKKGQKYQKTNSFCAEKQYEWTEEDILEEQKNLEKLGEKVDEVSFPFYEKTIGKWYTLGKEEDGEVWWALGLIDTDFDKQLSVSASWLSNEEDFENFSPVIVFDEYQEDLETLLGEMIESSPTKSLIIRPRYQSGENEIVQGIIPFEKYMKLLKEEKIPFNVYTIVRK